MCDAHNLAVDKGGRRRGEEGKKKRREGDIVNQIYTHTHTYTYLAKSVNTNMCFSDIAELLVTSQLINMKNGNIFMNAHVRIVNHNCAEKERKEKKLCFALENVLLSGKCAIQTYKNVRRSVIYL